MTMYHIEKRFTVMSEPAGCCLLVDDVTSCITGGEVYGTVQARLSVEEALALGSALVRAAEDAQRKTKSPERIAIDAALAAARAQAVRKGVGNA